MFSSIGYRKKERGKETEKENIMLRENHVLFVSNSFKLSLCFLCDVFVAKRKCFTAVNIQGDYLLVISYHKTLLILKVYNWVICEV